MLYGDGGLTKSLQAMLIGDCVARGQDLFARRVQQGRVLYLDWELDQDEQARRAYRVAAGLGFPLPAPGLFYRQMALPLTDALPQMKAWIEELEISFVILDSFGIATLGDPTTARDVIPLLRAVSCLPCTSLFIDHVRNLQAGEKAEDLRPFGSVYKYNIARSVIRAIRVGGDDISVSVLLRQTKSNFAALSEPLGIQVAFEEDRITFEEFSPSAPMLAGSVERMPAREKVHHALVNEGEAGIEELAADTGLASGTVKNKLTELRRQGRATPMGNGRWQAVQESSPSFPLSDGDGDDASDPSSEDPEHSGGVPPPLPPVENESGDQRSTGPAKTCYACGGTRFWRSVHGHWVCATCHPPASEDVVHEWLGPDGDPGQGEGD